MSRQTRHDLEQLAAPDSGPTAAEQRARDPSPHPDQRAGRHGAADHHEHGDIGDPLAGAPVVHPRAVPVSTIRMPVSVLVSSASRRERWCWTTNEREPTRHSACPADSIEISWASLHQPVLDDRPTVSTEEFDSAPGFDRPAVTLMWRHYLAGRQASADAAPARATELAGVAASLITCSELESLRDEAVDYAVRLMQAGVATELHVFPGTCHGFDAFVPEWETSRKLYAMRGLLAFD